MTHWLSDNSKVNHKKNGISQRKGHTCMFDCMNKAGDHMLAETSATWEQQAEDIFSGDVPNL